MNFFELLQASLKQMPRRRLNSYEPGRNDLCVCGSGIKFKKCCQGRYSLDATAKHLEYYNSGRYEEALRWARYKLTWYILCHQAHTVPLIEAKLPPANELLKVDIEALAELLADLHRCYYRTNRSDQFPKNIERLSSVVNDQRWKEKVIYLNALWFLVDQNDKKGAFESLAPIRIDQCEDPDILTLYIDVYPNKLNFDTKINLIDRVIHNTKIESHKLQYTVLKGVCYLLVCEFEEGCRIISGGIEHYRSLKKEKRSSYGETFFGHALDLLGRFNNQHDLIEESIKVYEGLINVAREKSYPDEYIGDLLKCIGESNEALHRYDIAVTNFTESLRLNSVEITKVFLARAELNSGNPGHARILLNELKTDLLDDAGLFDFAISYTLLAAITCAEKDLDKAKKLLKSAKNDWPLFIQQRDKWLIELLETAPVTESGRFRKLIQSLNKYVTLNPNLFGFGIDLNMIIEDIDCASRKNKS